MSVILIPSYRSIYVRRLLSSATEIPIVTSSSYVKTNDQSLTGGTKDKITELVRKAVLSSFPEITSTIQPLVLPCKPEFGDYQTNLAMIISKELKKSPKDVANILTLSPTFRASEIINEVTISGPGFLNFNLSESYIKNRLFSMMTSERLGLPTLTKKQRVIVDFSSPNIAKEMHVGHLRSTIIGDTISRILEYIGHDVLRLNHVGDWGTQFGMLIHYLKSRYPKSAAQYRESQSRNDGSGLESLQETGISDLVQFYKAAKKCFDEDAEFKEAAKNEVVKLQAGDEDSLLIWKAICQQSRQEFQIIYDLLNVTVNERGESFYNPYLDSVVHDLVSRGSAVDSQGATCIFVPGYTNPDGSPLPLIVKKSDGAYLYATTDLAALRHRTQVEKAERIIYVTDAGQEQHFAMVFAAARMTQMIPDIVELVHVPFGVVQVRLF